MFSVCFKWYFDTDFCFTLMNDSRKPSSFFNWVIKRSFRLALTQGYMSICLSKIFLTNLFYLFLVWHFAFREANLIPSFFRAFISADSSSNYGIKTKIFNKKLSEIHTLNFLLKTVDIFLLEQIFLITTS